MSETSRPRPNLYTAIVTLYVTSLVMIASAPFLMAESYSWIANTVSESGAQGVQGAWLFRAGVLTAAGATVSLVASAGNGMNTSSKRALTLYAIALVAAAAFPENPWFEGSHNEIVAGLHTLAAFNAGLWFGVGVFTASRHRSSPAARRYDLVMILMVATIPVLMLAYDSYEGLLQRILILAGYAWLFLETSRINTRSDTDYSLASRVSFARLRQHREPPTRG